MAKSLGFTQNQTVLYALARLRDELQSAQLTTPAPASQLSSGSSNLPLTTAQHQNIRQHSPKRRATPVLKSIVWSKFGYSIHAFTEMTGGGL